MYTKISESSIFNGINPGEVVHILNFVHHQIKSYESESIIAFSGDKCDKLYVLLEGSIRGEVVDYSGKVIKIEDVFAPNTFAEAFLFADDNELLVNIVANVDTKILIIYKNDLFKLFKSNTKILENYLNIVSNRFVTVTRKLKFLSLKTIKGKLAFYFLQIANKKKSKTIILDKTQQELADYFGITRPSLTRSIRELNNEGLIKASGKTIKILEMNEMKRQLVND